MSQHNGTFTFGNSDGVSSQAPADRPLNDAALIPDSKNATVVIEGTTAAPDLIRPLFALKLDNDVPLARAKSTGAIGNRANGPPGPLFTNGAPPMSIGAAGPFRAGPSLGAPQAGGAGSAGPGRLVAMTPEELAAEVRAAVSALPDETRLLIIDVRAADVFCRGQILGSVNICLPSTLLRRTSFGIEKLMETLKSEADLAAFNGIHQKTHIVVVDQSSERVTADMPVALLLAKFAKEGVPAKLAWLKGGFAAFSSEAPDLVVSSDPAQENGADRKPSLRLPSIAGAGAISVRPHTASTPGTRGKSVLTAPAGFFPPHGGPSSEYQTHVDSAPEELKRMKIFAKDEDLALADGVPRFLQNLLTGDEVTEKLKQKFKEIETEEQKRFQSSWRAKSPGDPFSISVGIEKGYKNRYSNIWPYNSNRVVLSGEATACDYINASFIDVPAKPRAYICTQGPIPSTFADFWLMVQETGARIVLMLTREEDHGRRQCHRYWPTKAEEVMDLGPYLSVTLVSEEQVSPHLIARKLILHHRNEPPLPVESRHVLQLQYTSWPDHGVPESAKPVIEFRDLVSCLRDRANKDAGSDVPLIVHCSAGCGRTGTFCTIDHVFDRLFDAPTERRPDNSNSEASLTWYDACDLRDPEFVARGSDRGLYAGDSDLVLETVQHLRTQRLLMVQTYAQLAFCYEALLNKFL